MVWNKGLRYFHKASFSKGHKPWNKGKKGVQVGYWKGKERLDLKGKKRPPFSKEWRKNLGNARRGKHGWPHKETTKVKIGKTKEFEKNWNWRGDKVKYRALHNWVDKVKGKPRMCEHCGRDDQKRYEWANINERQKNRRIAKDYMRLCSSCHIMLRKGYWNI